MKKRSGRKRVERRALPLHLVIGGLTVAGVIAVLAVANFAPGGGGSDSVSPESASHDVPRTTAGADIHFAVTEVDLGTIPVGKEVGYAFSYANVGNDTLRIDDVRVRVLEGC